MNPVESEIQVVVIDTLQFETVSNVDVSSLKIVSDGSVYRFAGGLVVTFADGSSKHFDGLHGRSDFVDRYGFGLFTFDEMVDHESRTFADNFDDIKTELDGDAVRRLRELRK